jgi:uncharacterized protein (DUF2252 family)
MKPAQASSKKLPSIIAATAEVERWASRQVSLVQGDIALEHRHMAKTVFPYMRATFYRWAQLWPVVCAELSRAPQVLAVGDLDVENFGTCDVEGRLVWGVNDFDEAWPAAYAVDPVRLIAALFWRLRISIST